MSVRHLKPSRWEALASGFHNAASVHSSLVARCRLEKLRSLNATIVRCSKYSLD